MPTYSQELKEHFYNLIFLPDIPELKIINKTIEKYLKIYQNKSKTDRFIVSI